MNIEARQYNRSGPRNSGPRPSTRHVNWVVTTVPQNIPIIQNTNAFRVRLENTIKRLENKRRTVSKNILNMTPRLTRTQMIPVRLRNAVEVRDQIEKELQKLYALRSTAHHAAARNYNVLLQNALRILP